MPVCSSCGKENPGEAKFCLACGTPIAEAASPAPVAPTEERKLITVVFTDLVGSTARSENLDPEDVKSMVAPYHARVRGELERYGGTFEKFSGDAVMALFGAPVSHEDDCERAVRAALAIRDAVAGLNETDEWLDLHIRVGVNTGEALVTLDARPSEGEWMAAGDVMNTAARMQSAAPVDGIFVGDQTYRQTRDAIEYREAEPIEAKGKSERVPVWEAVALRDGDLRRPTPEARLVGREAECEALTTLWRSVVAQKRPALATVLGSPGIGKTRLLAEIAAKAERDGDVHWGRCLSYGEGITYWPVTEILKDAAGIRHDDDAVATSAKLGALLESLDCDDQDQLRTIAAAMANVVGVATTPAGTYSAVEIGQAELHWGIRRLLELLAKRRPLVLVFEDLHWAEPTLLDLVQFVTESTAEAPILLVGSARPEARELRPLLFATAESRLALELEALGEHDSTALLEELAAETGLPAAALETVRRNAGGNPLFLEETVRMLAESGAVADGDGETLPVPSSLQALIASRLDQLPSTEKQTAQHASVVGTVFWSGALASLDGLGGDLAANLDALQRRDVVRARTGSAVAGEREYAFKHVLIRDVAYNQLPKGRRANLHRRFADWTNALPGGEDEYVEIVAYHLEQSCLLAAARAHGVEAPPVDEAVAALMRAAEKAERREGIREADRFYARALDIVGETNAATAVELRLGRARMTAAHGDLKAARPRLADVVDEAGAVGRQDVRCGALIALANAHWKQGAWSEARELLDEAVVLAEEIADRRLQVKAAFELANVRWWNETEVAVEGLRHALAIAEEMDDRALRVEGHMRLGFGLYNVGRLAEAEEELGRCVALAQDFGSHREEARATFQLGLVKYYRGAVEEAEKLGSESLAWLERISDTYLQIQGLRALAIYALARDDADLAEARLREALPLALEAGGWIVVEIYRYLVEALIRQDRLDDARELVSFAARNVPEEDAYARAAFLLAEARMATAGGEQAAAATSFAEALRLLEEQGLQIDLAEARIELARALRAFGDDSGARVELERSRGMVSALDARFLLDAIDAELAELVEGAGVSGPLPSD